MASRLGPAKPRGIGCEGAGGSVIDSQSRQVNFSRTCSTIFQRRGSHSSVFVTSSPSLRRRTPPHLPQVQGAGSTTRSTGRLSGSLRGPRGARARFSFAAVGRRDLGFGFFLALRLFKILDRQFELFDQELAAFGRLTELLAPRFGQQELQPLDLQRAKLRFALRHDPRRLFLFQQLALREDHRVGAGEVVGERFGGRRHEAK